MSEAVRPGRDFWLHRYWFGTWVICGWRPDGSTWVRGASDAERAMWSALCRANPKIVERAKRQKAKAREQR